MFRCLAMPIGPAFDASTGPEMIKVLTIWYRLVPRIAAWLKIPGKLGTGKLGTGKLEN
jgi:hypothetical protein